MDTPDLVRGVWLSELAWGVASVAPCGIIAR